LLPDVELLMIQSHMRYLLVYFATKFNVHAIWVSQLRAVDETAGFSCFRAMIALNKLQAFLTYIAYNITYNFFKLARQIWDPVC
jgi:hypothetical protein